MEKKIIKTEYVKGPKAFGKWFKGDLGKLAILAYKETKINPSKWIAEKIFGDAVIAIEEECGIKFEPAEK